MARVYDLKRRWGNGGDFNINKVAKGVDADVLKAKFNLGGHLSIEFVGSDIEQKCEKDEIVLLYSHFWLGCAFPLGRSVSEVLARWGIHPLQLSPGFWAVFARVARICKVYRKNMSSEILYQLLKPVSQNKASFRSYALCFHNQEYRFHGLPSNYKNAKQYGFKIKGCWKFENIDVPNNYSRDILKFPNIPLCSDHKIKREFVSLFSHDPDVYDLSFPDDIVNYYRDLEMGILKESLVLAPYCGSKKRKKIIVHESSDDEVEEDDCEDIEQEKIKKKKRSVRQKVLVCEKKKEKKTVDNLTEIEDQEMVICLRAKGVSKEVGVVHDIEDENDTGGNGLANNTSEIDVDKVDDGSFKVGVGNESTVNVVGSTCGVLTSAIGTITEVSNSIVDTNPEVLASVLNTNTRELTESDRVIAKTSLIVSSNVAPQSLFQGVSSSSSTLMLISADEQGFASEDTEYLILKKQRCEDFINAVNMMTSKLAEVSKLGSFAKEILEGEEDYKIKSSEFFRLKNAVKERDLIFEANGRLRELIMRDEMTMIDFQVKMNTMKVELAKHIEEKAVLEESFMREQKVLRDEVEKIKGEKFELTKQVGNVMLKDERLDGDYKLVCDENLGMKKKLEEFQNLNEKMISLLTERSEKNDMIEKHVAESKKSGGLLREALASVALWKARDAKKQERLQQLSNYYKLCYKKLEDASPSDLEGVPVPVEDSLIPQFLD